MTKILVVDDETDLETLIKQKFRQKIRDQLFEFHFANNGIEALEKIKQQPDMEIVLSDINMPEMDGLTLLSKLNEHASLIKSVIVSAYGDMANIRTAMNLGAYDFITKPIDFNDLSITIDKTLAHVHQMKETIKAIKENDILKMYVDENVLNFMNSRTFENTLLVNESIEGTVVFIDICSFTSISESENANKVIGLLNKYFDVMVEQIIAQNGHIDKFIGDAIMAVFTGDFHLDRAIDASIAVRNHITKLVEFDMVKDFIPKVSIGINTGDMISGNIGSERLKRLDYTVIGDTVNTAQRLQSLAKENQILINAAAYEKVKDSFQCTYVDEVVLKNKTQPMKIYEVIELCFIF
jgi:adenylate cyclase